jgi:hypothetical protein
VPSRSRNERDRILGMEAVTGGEFDVYRPRAISMATGSHVT